MRIGTMVLWGTLIVRLALLAGGVLLQIFLSRRQSRWPGLILPALAFLWSLVMLLNVAGLDGGFPWGPVLASLVLGNIPTAVLLAIYFACREKLRKSSEIDKMQIDDL